MQSDERRRGETGEQVMRSKSVNAVSFSLLDDHLDTSIILFLGCFAVFAAGARAERANFPPGLSVIVLDFLL